LGIPESFLPFRPAAETWLSITCQVIQAEGIISYCPPQAAFYVFPRVLTGLKDDRKFAFDLLDAKHILLVAGSGFDWPAPDHFRLVLLPDADKIYRAILEIGEFLKTYRQ